MVKFTFKKLVRIVMLLNEEEKHVDAGVNKLFGLQFTGMQIKYSKQTTKWASKNKIAILFDTHQHCMNKTF